MIFPLLPVFLTTILGAGAFSLGLIEGVSDSTSSLLKIISGVWSDRAKKKKIFIFYGYGLATIMRPMIGIALNWGAVLGFRFGDRIGKGIRTAPRDALIAASVPENQRGRAYGFHRMMDHAGAVLGSLIGAGLIYLMPGRFRLIFLSAAIPGIFSLFALARVKEVSAISSAESSNVSVPHIKLPPRAKGFLILLFFFTLGNATDAFLLLRLTTGGIAIALLPLLWAGLHIVKSSTNSIFGKLSDKMDRRFLLLVGWIFYGVVYALFSFSLSIPALIALFLVYGLFYGLTEGPEKALLSEWVDPSCHGKVFGWYHGVLGVALLPAGVLFGLLWDHWGYATAFGFGGAISLATALIWMIWMLLSRRAPLVF